MTRETEKCTWPLCGCEGVRRDPCPKDKSVFKRGGDVMNSQVANNTLSMVYAEHIDSIRQAVAKLEEQCVGEDPFIYTEVTRAALFEILSGMGKTRAVLVMWIEENPAKDLHHHSFSWTSNRCFCDDCNLSAKLAIEHLYEISAAEPERHAQMRDNLQRQFGRRP